MPPRFSAQNLTADYRFNNDYTSYAAAAPDLVDLIAPSQACPTYCNSFSDESVFGITKRVLTFPENNGVALSPTTPVLSNNGIYTIAVLAKFDNATGYVRIIDFKNGTS